MRTPFGGALVALWVLVVLAARGADAQCAREGVSHGSCSACTQSTGFWLGGQCTHCPSTGECTSNGLAECPSGGWHSSEAQCVDTYSPSTMESVDSLTPQQQCNIRLWVPDEVLDWAQLGFNWFSGTRHAAVTCDEHPTIEGECMDVLSGLHGHALSLILGKSATELCDDLCGHGWPFGLALWFETQCMQYDLPIVGPAMAFQITYPIPLGLVLVALIISVVCLCLGCCLGYGCVDENSCGPQACRKHDRCLSGICCFLLLVVLLLMWPSDEPAQIETALNETTATAEISPPPPSAAPPQESDESGAVLLRAQAQSCGDSANHVFEAQLVHEGQKCDSRLNLGDSFSTVDECAAVAATDPRCADFIMWSQYSAGWDGAWGCRCCSNDGDFSLSPHNHWNVYEVACSQEEPQEELQEEPAAVEWVVNETATAEMLEPTTGSTPDEAVPRWLWFLVGFLSVLIVGGGCMSPRTKIAPVPTPPATAAAGQQRRPPVAPPHRPTSQPFPRRLPPLIASAPSTQDVEQGLATLVRQAESVGWMQSSPASVSPTSAAGERGGAT
jgi:hypothetical protein